MSSAVRGNGQALDADGRSGSDRPLLMAGTALAPCIGCTLECAPPTCELLTEWLGLLARGPRIAPGPP